MNAMRITRAADNLRAWNLDIEREVALTRAREQAERVVPTRHVLATDLRKTRVEEVDVRVKGSTAPGEVIYARRVVCECHVDTLYAQHHITKEQHKALLWFRRRYLLGYKNPAVVAGYGERVAGGIGDVSVRVLDARHDLGELAALLLMLQWAAVETAAGTDMPLGRGGLRHLQGGADLIALWVDANPAK